MKVKMPITKREAKNLFRAFVFLIVCGILVYALLQARHLVVPAQPTCDLPHVTDNTWITADATDAAWIVGTECGRDGCAMDHPEGQYCVTYEEGAGSE